MQKRFSIAIFAALTVAFFASGTGVYAAGPSVVSAKITSSNAITIVYSEPVATSAGDYSNFTGSLSGAPLASITGSGTNTITLVFNGTPFQPGASGYLTIGTGVYGVSDATYFTGGTFSVTSAQVPILQSFSATFNNVNNAFSTVGSMVSINFTTNESVNNPVVTILGHTITVNGNGNGPYSVNYTLVSGDTEGNIPVTISFTDSQGNSGRATINISGTNNSLSNATGYITSNATTPGTLGLGNSITFTLHLSTPLPNARVSGYYNGVPLAWYTLDNGANYIATYTVSSGQSNQTSPLQITGVTVTDQYGNTSAPVSGSDVAKTINANSATPVIYVAVPVASVVNTPTPSYTFISNIAGTIRYTGDCSSQTSNAVVGSNTITFNYLADGTHSNCAITVTDSTGANTSNQLFISPFAVQTSGTGTTTQTTQDQSAAAQLQALQAQLAQLQAQQTAQNSANSYTFTTFLGFGSQGTAVTALQNKLTALGFYSGPVTGYFGSLTQAAVKKFQAAHGITQAGYVGPGTRAALNSAN